MKNIYYLLKTQTDQRLLRLFAVGCCRQIWEEITDQRSRTFVEVAERFADGQATKKELKKACDAADDAAHAATCVIALDAAYSAAYAAAYKTANKAAFVAARKRQLELYHCLFTKTVFTTTSQNAINLATIIYEDHNWTLMPILGDALEEAGTINEVVNHCKENEHARGCWVIDNLKGHRK